MCVNHITYLSYSKTVLFCSFISQLTPCPSVHIFLDSQVAFHGKAHVRGQHIHSRYPVCVNNVSFVMSCCSSNSWLSKWGKWGLDLMSHIDHIQKHDWVFNSIWGLISIPPLSLRGNILLIQSQNVRGERELKLSLSQKGLLTPGHSNFPCTTQSPPLHCSELPY